MKSLNEILTSSVNEKFGNPRYGVNIIVCCCGSMNSYITELKKLQKSFPNAEIWGYQVSEDRIYPVKDVERLDCRGPHPGDLTTIDEFMQDNLGALNIYVQC